MAAIELGMTAAVGWGAGAALGLEFVAIIGLPVTAAVVGLRVMASLDTGRVGSSLLELVESLSGLGAALVEDDRTGSNSARSDGGWRFES